LGATISVADHFGFLRDWYVLGPFDARGMKGFQTSFPPEQKVDLAASYEGKGQTVSWKRYQLLVPPHCPSLARATIEVQQWFDGTIHFQHGRYGTIVAKCLPGRRKRSKRLAARPSSRGCGRLQVPESRTTTPAAIQAGGVTASAARLSLPFLPGSQGCCPRPPRKGMTESLWQICDIFPVARQKKGHQVEVPRF
jgi:hypothetical protein